MQRERSFAAGHQGPQIQAWLCDAATGRRFSLDSEAVVVIGRGPQADAAVPGEIPLGDDRFVSRRHAQIVPVDGAFWFFDLASANGSFLNNRRVTAACLLRAGDLIQVGNTTLSFEHGEAVRLVAGLGCP